MNIPEYHQRSYHARSHSAQSFGSNVEPPAALLTASPATTSTSSSFSSDHISQYYKSMTALVQDVIRPTVASVSRFFVSDTAAENIPTPSLLSMSTGSSRSKTVQKHAEMSERGRHLQKARDYIHRADSMKLHHGSEERVKTYKKALRHACLGQDLRLQSQAHERIARYGRTLSATKFGGHAALRVHADQAKYLAFPGSHEHSQATATRTSLA